MLNRKSKKMNIKTQSVHFTADQKLIDFIDKKIGKLDGLGSHIIGVEVILKLENSGQIRDKVTEVKLNMPGNILFTKQVAKTFETAIEKSVDTLRTQITRYKGRNNQAKRRRSPNI